MTNLRLVEYFTEAIANVVLPPEHRSRLDNSAMAREQIAGFRVLNIDFFPRESHLITFRDPWSFPMLFHPACNQLVRKHMDDLAQKVATYSSWHPLYVGVMLTLDLLDSLDMCIVRRISNHSLSQSSECNARGQRVMFASCPFCTSRARQVRSA